MEIFICIFLLMASVVLWSLDSTQSAHVKITNLDGDVLYDTVMVVELDTSDSNYHDFFLDSLLTETYYLNCINFEYKDKSFYIEIKLFLEDSPFYLNFVTPYINGKKHGVKKYYEKSGQLWRETPYVNGVEHGLEKRYYESGQLGVEIPFVNGKEHGIEKFYYKSGKLSWETPFVNGEAHGVRKWYNESGQLGIEIPFVNGKEHGIRKEYNNKGEVISTTKYKNGVLDGYKRCSDGRFGNEEFECQ